MSQTLDNGIVVPINSDGYNLAADLATMGGKSNVITNVASQTARNALTTYSGRTVRRTDLTPQVLQTYNGAAWDAGPGQIEWTYPLSTVLQNSPVTFLTGTLDATQSFNTETMPTTSGATFTIQAPGIYAIHWFSDWTTPVKGYLQIRDASNNTLGGMTQPVPADTLGFMTATIPGLYLAAGAVLNFRFLQNTGAASALHRVRFTRYA
jgi:hypothetical protein